MRQLGIFSVCALTILVLFQDRSYGDVEAGKQSNIVKGLQLRLRLDKARWSVKQQVTVHIEIHNTSTTEKMIHLSSPDYDFQFDITVRDGREPVSLTECGKRRLGEPKSGSFRSKRISAGESYAVDVDLSRLYDLSSPGTYRLTAKYLVKTGPRQWKDLVVKDVFFKIVEEGDTESVAAHGAKHEKSSKKKAADIPDNAVQQGPPASVGESPQRLREKETGKVPVATTEKFSPITAEEPQRLRLEEEAPKPKKAKPGQAKDAKEVKQVKEETNWLLPGLIATVIVLAGAVVFLLTRRKGRGAA